MNGLLSTFILIQIITLHYIQVGQYISNMTCEIIQRLDTFISCILKPSYVSLQYTHFMGYTLMNILLASTFMLKKLCANFAINNFVKVIFELTP